MNLDSEALAIFMHKVYVLIATSVLYYDYILTFSMEVERFWIPRKINLASVLFFSGRYVGVIGYIPILYLFCARSLSEWVRCKCLQSYYRIFIITIQLVGACLMAMRVYALYDRKSAILWILSVIIIVTVLLSAWAVALREDSSLPTLLPKWNQCIPVVTSRQSKVILTAWTGQLLFDFLTFLLIIFRSWRIGQQRRLPIVAVLMRDGTFYFAGTCLLSVVNISMITLSSPLYRAMPVPLVIVLSNTLSSRLTLNLRDPKLVKPAHNCSSSGSQSEMCNMSTVVTLGYPLASDDVLRLRTVAVANTPL